MENKTSRESPISPFPPAPVRFPVMYQSWNHISFLHWRYPADALQARLPRGLTADIFEGSAWISITPFLLEGLRPPFLPALPWVSRFPETNLRTYVQGPAGPGIWFFSLDAARLTAVAGARATYRLPYMWSRMTVSLRQGGVRYTSRRHRPFPRAEMAIEIRTGEPYGSHELTEWDHFVTARFRLYTRIGGRLAYAPVDHEPWLLQRAAAVHVEQSVSQAAKLGPLDGAPRVHFSPGVRVRVARPRFA